MSLIERYRSDKSSRRGSVKKVLDAKQRESIKRHSVLSIAAQSHFGTYSREEVLQLADLLYSMDQNDDGDIEAAEFEYYIRNGKHGEIFRDLNFDLMDVDHSGSITVREICDICFGNASALEKQKIIICIEEEKKRR